MGLFAAAFVGDRAEGFITFLPFGRRAGLDPVATLAMEGFDTMALPYLASPLSLSNIQGTDYLNSMPGMDLPDQRSNFDSETFVR